MKQLVRQVYRAAFWAVLAVMLVATLATSIAPARAATSSYTLIGYASQPGNGTPPVPAGVQVDLVSRATGVVYTTTIVGGGGQFKFTTASTSGALAPGYWGVWIPAQTNISLANKPYAILPQNQSPTWVFENQTTLTSVSYPVDLYDVAALPYVGELKGTVYSSGEPVSGATVSLLAANYNAVDLENNTTNASGYFTLKAPLGTWVLESALPGSTTYYNYTSVTVSGRAAKVVDTNISTYLISGYSKINTLGNPRVPNAGNATLYDPLNGYIYSTPTAPGGFYSLGTYAANFTGGKQPFDVILSNIGYRTTWFPINITSASPIYHNVYVNPQTNSTLGVYNTTIDFAAVNVTSGTGNVTVKTLASLGNDTVFGSMPNGSVGQLWGQLGLDLVHSTVFPASDLGLIYARMNASGPFFPIAQAQLTVNGTGFANPTAPQSLSSWGSSCTTTCGLNSSANITLGWSGTYALNGTIPKNSSLYTISFNFRHPSSAEVYNYSIVLPDGYVLAAGTSVPSKTTLVPNGPDHTWTKFTLTSYPGPSGVSSARFNIVKSANLTANVNVSVSTFTYSSSNVLNSTHGNYTVIVGVNQNVTFSALNSTYPAGTNGTKFVWNFGDGSSPVTTTTPTTNHTYKVATSGTTPYVGSVNITASGGQVNNTTFKVWVGSGPVTAGLSVNASAAQTRSASGVTYYMVNWSTVLSLNATASSAKISPGTPSPKNVISVALFTTAGRGFKSITIQNISRSAGANPLKNVSYQFLGAGAYIINTTINGVPIAFKGWQYNVTLRVWAASGQSASTTVIFLVVDTQKPVPAFTILNAAGRVVSGSGVQVGTNLTAKVQFNATNSTDPNNGSISKYSWKITNSGNSTFKNVTWNQSKVRPLPSFWLSPQSKPYTVNLTVWDLNGNSAYTTQSLQVSTNTTYNVLMAANNLTAPSSYTQGSTYTLWVNITVGGGSKATAQNVTVAWYLLSASGSGSKNFIGGAPGSVSFYNYTGGVVNSTPFATGKIPTLAFNKTVRAQITWTPGASGNYLLYANVTASNEWAGDIPSGPGIVSRSISVTPSSTTQLLEYAAIGVAVVVVIALIIFFYRRRGRTPPSKSGSGKSGLERGGKKPADEDDEDES